MFLRLLIVFTVIPLIELALLIKVGSIIGIFWTLLLVVTTALAGTYLVKKQGIAVIGRIQQQLGSGRIPAEALLDGILILVAAVLLITPGILTDASGFCLLIPLIRLKIKLLLTAHFARIITNR